MRLSTSRGSIGTTLAVVAGVLIGLVVVAGGVVALADKFGEDPDEFTQQFIDYLHPSAQPGRPEPGEVVTFFVQGEPPAALRAHQYADLLSEDSDRLFRLDSRDRSPPPRPIAYPLPENYVAPVGTLRLQTRQRIRIPEQLAPGRYTIRTPITGVRRDRGYRGTPSATLPIVAPARDR